jgi:hypothetical protein
MFDNYQICPYTGLRSFSEDESLYFKGREEDIDQATLQLQKNKFLMLTGASGMILKIKIYKLVCGPFQTRTHTLSESRQCISEAAGYIKSLYSAGRIESWVFRTRRFI